MNLYGVTILCLSGLKIKLGNDYQGAADLLQLGIRNL